MPYQQPITKPTTTGQLPGQPVPLLVPRDAMHALGRPHLPKRPAAARAPRSLGGPGVLLELFVARRGAPGGEQRLRGGDAIAVRGDVQRSERSGKHALGVDFQNHAEVRFSERNRFGVRARGAAGRWWDAAGVSG